MSKSKAPAEALDYLTMQDVSRRTGIAVKTLANARSAGREPFGRDWVKIGGRVLMLRARYDARAAGPE